MKSTILMTSVAVAALASPAFAGPDRYEQGTSCIGMSGAECVQQEMRLEDGNRASEKPGDSQIESGATASTGSTSATDGTAFSASSGDDDDLGDEVGDEADEFGDEVSDTADEAGDEIADTADEAGDEISDAADEAGDAISSAFD